MRSARPRPRVARSSSRPRRSALTASAPSSSTAKATGSHCTRRSTAESMTAMQPARPAIDIPETGNEGMPLIVLETNRLVLRQLTCDDAGFILELLNDPSWIEFIGDKGVHDLDAAREYIIRGPLEMYATLGFGLYL